MTLFRPLWLALALLAGSAVLRLGMWSSGPAGVDAVSAVTPGDIAVVGAGAVEADGAPESSEVTDLVRRAAYLSGGIHKAVDPGSEWILVRPAHLGIDTERQRNQHLELLDAVVGLLSDVAPQAQISVLVGAVPGAPETTPEGLEPALGAWLQARDADNVEVIDLAVAEWEPIDVPEGGEAADIYPVPIALLECDALVNVAAPAGAFSALRNLGGLVGVPESDGWPPAARWIDAALLAEASYTFLGILDTEATGGPVVLGSPDGMAVDGVGMALTAAAGDSTIFQVAEERWLGVGSLEGIKVNGLDVAGTWAPAPDSAATQ